MFKYLMIGVAAASFAGSAIANEWAFDDDYWKEQLNRSTFAQAPLAFADSNEPIRDVATVDEGPSGVSFASTQDDERAAFERAGFTQFVQ